MAFEEKIKELLDKRNEAKMDGYYIVFYSYSAKLLLTVGKIQSN